MNGDALMRILHTLIDIASYFAIVDYADEYSLLAGPTGIVALHCVSASRRYVVITCVPPYLITLRFTGRRHAFAAFASRIYSRSLPASAIRFTGQSYELPSLFMNVNDSYFDAYSSR
jgi:hypothetical protein